MMKPKDQNRLWLVGRTPTRAVESRHDGIVLEYIDSTRQRGMKFSDAEAYANEMKTLHPEYHYFLLKAMFEVVPATGYTLKDLD